MPRGRPRKDPSATKPEMVVVRLSTAEAEALTEMSKRRGETKTDLVRKLILEAKLRESQDQS